MWPLVLNILSEGTLVAGIQRNFLATFESIGISCVCAFHQARGSSSLLIAGRDTYSLLSESTLSSIFGISLPEAADLCLFAVVMCCNNPDRLFSFFLVVVEEVLGSFAAVGSSV